MSRKGEIRKKSTAMAAILLSQYRAMNNDLPKITVEALAPFYLAYRVGKTALNDLYGKDLGATPFFHRSWFWWNCMKLSDMKDYWDEFVKQRNSGMEMKECLSWLKTQTSQSQWDLLKRRLGYRGRFSPSFFRSRHLQAGMSRHTVWTKGGSWILDSNFTRLIVLKKHLPPRDFVTSYLRRLGKRDVERIESEIMSVIDPDRILHPSAKRMAVEYARARLGEVLLPRSDRKAGYATTSWFFGGEAVLDNRRLFHLWPGGKGFSFRSSELERSWKWMEGYGTKELDR